MITVASRKTACAACAKIKIKCDKTLPRCSRCARLGIDCIGQPRRRGRPNKPTSTTATTTLMSTTATPAVAVVAETTLISKRQSQGVEQSLPLIACYEESNQTPGNDIVYKYNMVYDCFILALRKKAQERNLNDDIISKCVAATKWLGYAACSINSKEMHDELSAILKMFRASESLDAFEERSLLTESDKSMTTCWTPSYISSMNCNGSAFIGHHFVNGSSFLLANEDMTEQFVSTREANILFSNSGGDPSRVFKSIFARSDKNGFMTSLIGLYLNNPDFDCESSVLVSCIKRGYNQSSKYLSLCQQRLAISKDGRNVCLGVKFTPLPSQSPYFYYPTSSQALTGNSFSSSSSSSSLSSSSSSSSRGRTSLIAHSSSYPRTAEHDSGVGTDFFLELLENDSSSVVTKEEEKESPQPQTRELSYYLDMAGSWSDFHPLDTTLAQSADDAFSELDAWDTASTLGGTPLEEESHAVTDSENTPTPTPPLPVLQTGPTTVGHTVAPNTIAFESHIFQTVHHQKRDITIHLNIEPQVEDATTSTVNTKRKTYSSNSEGSSTKLPHYDDVSWDMNRKIVDTCSDEEAETKRSSPPQRLNSDLTYQQQEQEQANPELEEFLDHFNAQDTIAFI